MIARIKNIAFVIWIITLTTACNPDEVKQEQSIYFEEIPPQMLRDGSIQLKAASSSGLPVTFRSDDITITSIEGDRAVFHTAGRVRIYASQPGSDRFYEAPEIYHDLLIRDWDDNKKIQTISFELPSEWKLSRDGQLLTLVATASSGLPVSFTLSGPKAGYIIPGRASTLPRLYVYHGGETDAFRDKYETTITVIASQEGNDEYNPADNVEREMHIIGDVLH